MDTTLNKEGILQILREHLSAIRDGFKVSRIGLFGSHVREDVVADSDIDILVEFEQNTFDNYMNLKAYLEIIFQKEVDLILADSLKPRLRRYVLGEVVYAERL